MSYLLPAILSYLLNAFSVLTDKFLLTEKVPNPLVYVFYISALSMVSILLIPFTQVPPPTVLIIAFSSTLAWTIGAYFLFYALKVGLASRAAPVIGTLVPILLTIYYGIFSKAISLNEIWGIGFLIFGLILIILPYLRSKTESRPRGTKLKEFGAEGLAGIFFALSYVLLKTTYNYVPFLTGLVWSKMILIPIVLIILAIPALRRLVLTHNHNGPKINFFSKIGLLFLADQTAGGLSGILLAYAISLANPALVNSLQGTQYAVLFLASLVLARPFPQVFKENLSKKIVALKIIGIGLIAFGLFMLAFADAAPKKITLGITYSPRYATSLGLDPKAAYTELLTDLHPQTVRLPVYWDEIEPSALPGSFDFSNLDSYIQTSQQFNTKLTLVVGFKVPRYPECFAPSWTSSLSNDDFNKALFNELTTVVNRYKELPNLQYWQVENEPLFPFGMCPGIDFGRLQQEVKLVRSLDPGHPIMVTESGEYGLWVTTAKTADIIGTTLYRRTLAPYYPDFKSPLPPFFYEFKGMLVHLLAPDRKIFVSELQAEPWSNKPLTDVPLADQFRAFPVSELSDNVEFSEKAQFDVAYLWGAEWWDYLKLKGHPEYLDKAAQLFK